MALIAFGAFTVLILLGPYFGLNLLSDSPQSNGTTQVHRKSDPVLDELGIGEEPQDAKVADHEPSKPKQEIKQEANASSSKESLDEVERLLR